MVFTGLWSCPHCDQHGPPQAKEEEDRGKGNMDYCRVCKEGGGMLLCDSCPSSFHAYCIYPPLDEVRASDFVFPMDRSSGSES